MPNNPSAYTAVESWILRPGALVHVSSTHKAVLNSITVQIIHWKQDHSLLPYPAQVLISFLSLEWQACHTRNRSASYGLTIQILQQIIAVLLRTALSKESNEWTQGIWIKVVRTLCVLLSYEINGCRYSRRRWKLEQTASNWGYWKSGQLRGILYCFLFKRDKSNFP